MLLLSSVVTGIWGVSALARANWLEASDLPAFGLDTWGIGMLVLASVQGITALLIIFDRRLGIYLGIAFAVLSILVNISMFTAFPIGSLLSIGASLAGHRRALRLPAASALTRRSQRRPGVPQDPATVPVCGAFPRSGSAARPGIATVAPSATRAAASPRTNAPVNPLSAGKPDSTMPAPMTIAAAT